MFSNLIQFVFTSYVIRVQINFTDNTKRISFIKPGEQLNVSFRIFNLGFRKIVEAMEQHYVVFSFTLNEMNS